MPDSAAQPASGQFLWPSWRPFVVHWTGMQRNPVVNRPRLLVDRSPRRSRRYTLFPLCLLLFGLLLAGAPQAAMAQTRQTTAQPAQQPAEQPASPDTDQTKINQPQPTAASATPASIVLTTIRDDQGIMAVAVPVGLERGCARRVAHFRSTSRAHVVGVAQPGRFLHQLGHARCRPVLFHLAAGSHGAGRSVWRCLTTPAPAPTAGVARCRRPSAM